MRTFLRIALWHQHVSAVIKTTILRATQLFPCSVGKGLKTFIIFLRAVFKLAVCLSLPHEYQNIRFLLLHSNSVIRPDVVSDHFIVQEDSSGYLKPTLSRVVVNNSVCECAASAEFDELRGVSVCCLLVWPTMANESNKRMLGGKKQKQKKTKNYYLSSWLYFSDFYIFFPGHCIKQRVSVSWVLSHRCLQITTSCQKLQLVHWTKSTKYQYIAHRNPCNEAPGAQFLCWCYSNDTVDGGLSGQEVISQTELLQLWHPFAFSQSN